MGSWWVSDDPHGPLKVYAEPVRDRTYVLGADACEGRGSEGDNACVQILDAETWEQVAVWCDRVDPDEFAQVVLDMARWYEEAFVVLESQGGGQEVSRLLTKGEWFHRWRRKEWDRMGNEYKMQWDWHTNSKSRPVLVAGLRSAVRTRRLTIHDPDTIEEMMGWARLPTPRGGLKEGPADSDGHDDRIIALGLAIQGVLLDVAWDEDETGMEEKGLPPAERRKGAWLVKRQAKQRGSDWGGGDDDFGDHWS